MCTKIAMWLCGSSNVAASLATHGRMSSIRATRERQRPEDGLPLRPPKLLHKNSQTRHRHRSTHRRRREKPGVPYSIKTTPSLPTERHQVTLETNPQARHQHRNERRRPTSRHRRNQLGGPKAHSSESPWRIKSLARPPEK